MAVIPDTNIHLATNVGQVLNSAGGSVNQNQPVTYFQSAAKIAPFAKYKPTEYQGDFPIQEQQWHSKDMTCQVNVKLASTLSSLKDMFESGDIGWNFKYWNASTTYPYRLGDFRKYKSDAKSCIEEVYAPLALEVASGVNNQAYITVRYRVQDAYELKFSDIQASASGSTIDNWYLGMVYYTSKNSTLKIITSGSKITSNLNDTVLVTVTSSDTGTFYAYPVLSQSPYTNAVTTLNSGTYITPVPSSKKVAITISESVAFSMSINTSASSYTMSGTQVKVTAAYIIKGKYGGRVTGTWWYQAIDEDGMALGSPVQDPFGAQEISYTADTTINGTYTNSQWVSLESANNALFAGVRAEFRNNVVGNIGGNIFTKK